MDLKLISFLFRYQPFLCYRKHNGRLMNEMKKIKDGAKKPSKTAPILIRRELR